MQSTINIRYNTNNIYSSISSGRYETVEGQNILYTICYSYIQRKFHVLSYKIQRSQMSGSKPTSTVLRSSFRRRAPRDHAISFSIYLKQTSTDCCTRCLCILLLAHYIRGYSKALNNCEISFTTQNLYYSGTSL